jgi:calmodulin
VVLKKMREDDIEEQLSEAFRIVGEHKEKDKEAGFLESDFLKELLMTMGYKWGEEQADEFIKEFEPKAEKRIYPNEVVKKLIKR